MELNSLRKIVNSLSYRLSVLSVLLIVFFIIAFQQPSKPANVGLNVPSTEFANTLDEKPINFKKLIEPFNVLMFFLVVSTAFLWSATAELAEGTAEQSRDLKESISATKKLAEAAMLSVGSERAWISFDTLHPAFTQGGTINDRENKRLMFFNIVWINSGRSPALEVETAIHLEIKPVSQVKPPCFDPKRPDSVRSAPIGAGRTVNTSRVVIKDVDVDDFIACKTRFFIYSRVFYRDVFNSEIIRQSEVCLSVSCNGSKPHPTWGTQPNLQVISVGSQNTAT